MDTTTQDCLNPYRSPNVSSAIRSWQFVRPRQRRVFCESNPQQPLAVTRLEPEWVHPWLQLDGAIVARVDCRPGGLRVNGHKFRWFWKPCISIELETVSRTFDMTIEWRIPFLYPFGRFHVRIHVDEEMVYSDY